MQKCLALESDAQFDPVGGIAVPRRDNFHGSANLLTRLKFFPASADSSYEGVC
jgi:hypothetical protein